jgi:integrase
MAKFSSPAKQAASVMKQLQGTHIKSVGTVRNYEQALTRVATFLKENNQGTLRQLDTQRAAEYLEIRGQEVNQKSLDMERQAIQSMMQDVTNQLMPGTNLTRTQSELTQALNSRFYEPVQAAVVADAQTEVNALATQIALTAGLRAHELHTLRQATERPADPRPTHEGKFAGRDGVRYTVHGKGGLTREVLIPHSLAQKLESLRHNTAMKITDRSIHYHTHYAIGGGQRWSNSFSAASNRTLGWSRGAHGLRHTYAQQRMQELQKLGYIRDEALLIVSQELGHFRPDICEIYLK